jgi:hypothetical protein
MAGRTLTAGASECSTTSPQLKARMPTKTRRYCGRWQKAREANAPALLYLARARTTQRASRGQRVTPVARVANSGSATTCRSAPVHRTAPLQSAPGPGGSLQLPAAGAARFCAWLKSLASGKAAASGKSRLEKSRSPGSSRALVLFPRIHALRDQSCLAVELCRHYFSLFGSREFSHVYQKKISKHRQRELVLFAGPALQRHPVTRGLEALARQDHFGGAGNRVRDLDYGFAARKNQRNAAQQFLFAK